MNRETEQDPKTQPSRFKRFVRQTVLTLGVALVCAFGIKAAVAESFVVQTDAVAPEVPKGARLIVYKLASEYRVGDIVLYKSNGKNYVGRVANILPNDQLTIERNDEPDAKLAASELVGRCVLNTR